ncbi:MAG: aspartate-semialdehyde dehydrogenase [Corallococcus sp.]|nr:aspartate-semialdehyde dehydrogenase [Corallococcus sp.]
MKKIAIIGATGLVGRKLLSVLERNNFQAEYTLFGSSASAGEKLDFMHKEHTVLPTNKISERKFDYAMMMSSADVAKEYAPVLIANGTTCIDNSSAYRNKPDVPLVVDSINGHLVKNSNLIANPNCTTIQVVTVLNALKDYGLKRIVVSTYQSVSGAGKAALDDLKLNLSYGNLRGSLHPLSDNIVPQIDDFEANGYTKEEMKMVNECRKILSLPNLAVTCTAVRVPVTVGHAAHINIQFNKDFKLSDVKQKLQNAKNVVIADDTEHNIYPMPIIARGTPYVYVGRIREDLSCQNAIECFVVADNLLRGASYNAYEILVRAVNAND